SSAPLEQGRLLQLHGTWQEGRLSRMSITPTESGGDPSIQFELVHAVRGRTRMRVTPPEQADQLARAVERMLRDQPGIRHVRSNVDSGSIVITYDPEMLRLDHLFGVETPP